jgi:hypothetical protein
MGRDMHYTSDPVPLPSRLTYVKVPSFIANDETLLTAQMTFLLRFT